MSSFRFGALPPGVLLGVAGLGAGLYLYGLAATLQFGDARTPGVLLVPTLPTPMYLVMGVVMLTGVGLTILASLRQRRRRAALLKPAQETIARTPWQAMVSLWSSLALLMLGIVWLMRHGEGVLAWLDRLRADITHAQELLEAGAPSLVQQVQSPTTGYAMFTIVMVVYGGLAVLGVWLLCERWGRGGLEALEEGARSRQVQRAVAAGLQALHLHSDPRQAIIACYARLEHLLTDYGVPAQAHLTPQEYLGLALQDLDLPMPAVTGLVALFERARYSLHPLDETARATAIASLEQVQAHLTQEPAYAPSA